jgi:hypothetical protein
VKKQAEPRSTKETEATPDDGGSEEGGCAVIHKGDSGAIHEDRAVTNDRWRRELRGLRGQRNTGDDED